MADPVPYHREIRFRGFYPSQDKYSPVPDTAFDGANCWPDGDSMVADKGAVAAGSTGGASPLMIAGSAVAGMSGGVGVVLSFLAVYWFAGSGNALIDGSFLGTSTGKLNLVVGGVTYAAGLAAPVAAPTVSDSLVADGVMSGSWAFAVAKFRSSTGAVSSRSPISVPIAVNKTKPRIALPSNPGDGTTHWLLYATFKNFAGLGLVFRVTNIAPIAVGTTTIDVSFQDGDLGDAAELTNNPAPTCTHCCSLGSLMCAITAGGMVYPSKIAQPEAFDPDLAVRLAGGEAPTCVIPQGVEGAVFVGTATTISILILSGNPDVPVLPRGVFAHTGVRHGNAMCWAFDQLWGISSKGMPFRSHGGDAPDSSFAIPVRRLMRSLGFTGANTFVVHDENNDSVLYCSGAYCLAYNVPLAKWSATITLPGAANGAVDSRVAIGSTLYTLNAGSTPSGTVFLQSPYDGADGRIITLEGVRGIAPNDCTFDVLGDFGGSIGGLLPWTFTAPEGGTNKVLKTNRKARNFAGKWTATAAGASPNSFWLEGSIEPGTH
jgi:hypothetical protein